MPSLHDKSSKTPYIENNNDKQNSNTSQNYNMTENMNDKSSQTNFPPILDRNITLGTPDFVLKFKKLTKTEKTDPKLYK